MSAKRRLQIRILTCPCSSKTQRYHIVDLKKRTGSKLFNAMSQLEMHCVEMSQRPVLRCPSGRGRGGLSGRLQHKQNGTRRRISGSVNSSVIPSRSHDIARIRWSLPSIWSGNWLTCDASWRRCVETDAGCRVWRNVHDWFCDYQHCTPMKLRCDVFGMLETENGKMTRQECKQPYLYIFKMTDKTGSSNRLSSSTAQSQFLTHTAE